MSVIRVIGWDPGLTLAGWAVLEYNTVTNEIVVDKFEELRVNKVVDRAAMRTEVSNYGKRVIALKVLTEKAEEIIKTQKPTYIATEDAFYNPKMPVAYAALINWITTLAMLCYRTFNQPVFRIPTKIAKQAVCGTGSAGKFNVQQAIRESIKFKRPPKEEELTETVCDAIAVAVGFIHNDLQDILNGKALLE